MSTLRNNRFFAAVGSVTDLIGSAAAVAAAVESGRSPKARHLKTLGIEADAFRAINRH